MKYIKYILIFIALLGILSPLTRTSAAGAGGSWADEGYQLLAPLPCETGKDVGCVNGKIETFDPAQPDNLSVYLNLMIKIFIGLCAVLAVVMIVVGGLEYMTSELVSSKEAGKGRIRNALIGLVIALGAYALLFTINPDLLNLQFSTNMPVENVTVELPPTGNCVVRASGGATTIQTTQANCESNPNSQSWNGVRTSNAIGTCTFRKQSDLTRTTSQTTKINCEVHGTRFISWVAGT